MPRRNKPTKPLSIRVTEEERTRLAKMAGKRPLGVYVREKLFGEEPSSRTLRVPSHDARQLAQLLALLGQSNTAATLRELAEAARVGALTMDGQTQAAMQAALHSIQEMRAALMRGLGHTETIDP